MQKRIEGMGTYHIIVYENGICNLTQCRPSTQDRADFLLRDRFHPTVPVLGGCLPILLVDTCARTQPVTVRPRGRLKFLEEFPKRFLELFGRSGVRVLHVGCG